MAKKKAKPKPKAKAKGKTKPKPTSQRSAFGLAEPREEVKKDVVPRAGVGLPRPKYSIGPLFKGGM